MTRKLNTISRTATFAWSPGNQTPMVATGTIAGTVDDSFTNASDLEIFNLDLESNNLQASSKVSITSRFNTLAWGHSTAEKPYGVIAGGMESGELELWDPSVILSGKSSEDALILRNTTHTGTLKAIDFNRFQTNLLASAGSHSEVYIWDLNNPTTPYTPGTRSAKMDDISSVAWNCQVQHILSTASTNGYTVVWDLRNKKEVMTLAHSGQSAMMGSGRGSISSIAWHPNIATQIVTASDDDQNPIISLWDLRHAHSPEKTLVGHNKGILDVSWCRQDSDLLISSGKDCKTLCWNPNTGVLNGQLSSNNKWTFEVDWCPHNPDLLATSSFDGSINVFSIQGNPEESTGDTSANVPISDDPFDAALSAAAPSVQPFALTVPPKWLRRPVGASFGFSGKLVTFNNKNTINNTMTHSVKIIHVETDPEIVKRSEQLESASKLGVEQLIQDRIQTGDRKDWEAIKVLFSENAREELIKYLGFEKEQVMMTAQDLLNKSNMKPNETIHTEDLPAPNNTISTLFGSSETVSPDEVFFGQVAAKEQVTPVDEKPLAHVAPLVNRPFSLYPEGSTDADHLITRAIVLGDFESAVNVCLSSERYSDALLLAICGGSELLAKTQKTYFEKQSKKFTYLRLLEGILEEDLGSIVRDADLNEWSSVLAVLCTFSQTKDFGPLCEVFGDRLAQDAEMDQHATLFYLIAGNLEKVSKVWIDRFEKEDVEQGDSSTHGSRLQALIEKVTIFRQAIDYEDSALNNAEMKGDYPLSSLYDKYCEYAEFMATQGKLEVALKYISLTPSADPKSKISKSSIVRDRVYHANNSQSGQYTKPVFPFEKKQLSSKQGQQQPIILQNPHVQPNQQRHVGPPQPAMNLYAPVNVAQEPIHLYAPTHMTPAQQHQHHYSPYVLQNQHTNYSGAITDAYNNQQTQMYTQQHDLVPQQNYGPSVQQTALATPPPPPPPPSKSTGAWNDPPMLLSPKNNNKKKPQYVNADIVPTKRVTTPFAGNSPTSTAGSPQQQSNMHAPSPMNTTPPPPMRGLWGPSAPTAPPPPPSSGTTVGYYSAHQQPQQFQPPPQQTKATQLPPPPMNAVAPSPMRSFPAPPHQQQGF